MYVKMLLQKLYLHIPSHFSFSQLCRRHMLGRGFQRRVWKVDKTTCKALLLVISSLGTVTCDWCLSSNETIRHSAKTTTAVLQIWLYGSDKMPSAYPCVTMPSRHCSLLCGLVDTVTFTWSTPNELSIVSRSMSLLACSCHLLDTHPAWPEVKLQFSTSSYFTVVTYTDDRTLINHY